MKKYHYHPKTGKRAEINDDMIALRNQLAAGLGYVLRDVCTLSTAHRLASARPCWESSELNHVVKATGLKCASLHVVPESKVADGIEYGWPEKAELAALGIDGGKMPKPVKRSAQTELAAVKDKDQP